MSRSIRFWSKTDRHGTLSALRIGAREAWVALEGASGNQLRAGFRTTRETPSGRRSVTLRVRLGRVVIAGGVW